MYGKYRDEIFERKKGKVPISLSDGSNIKENFEEGKSDALEIQEQKDLSSRKRKPTEVFETKLKFNKTKGINLNNDNEEEVLCEESLQEILIEEENEEEQLELSQFLGNESYFGVPFISEDEDQNLSY